MSEHFSGGNLKTSAKLKILDWYLEPYVNIIDKYWEDYWYVDTHAGTGRTECDNGVLIDGSAIRALDEYADKFTRFYFYELDPNHFHTLHETLTTRFGYEFEVSEAKPTGADFLVARHYDPYIKIMQTDSNEGVSFLANQANSNPHWFTFVDPKGLTARSSTLDTLIRRGNMDILINYQTSGVMRNAAKDAEHGHEAVTRTLGDDDWPIDGSEEDYVRCFVERLRENEQWDVLSKNMQDPNDRAYRFDLVFASSNDSALDIMEYIMEERDDLWEKASEELGQPGFDSFT